MIRIETGPGGLPRLVATTQLSREDFEEIAARLGQTAVIARKAGFVAARQSDTAQRIETRWNGRETVANAEPGDWIATNMDADGSPIRDGELNVNVYVIKKDRFPELYAATGGSNEHGEIFGSRGTVSAIELGGGFEILAPWGEIQRADAGYLIDNGSEVYGNAKETFAATYVWA
ncbi:MAG: hypothetical protein KDJ37_15950 [Hyphomicrobiaceae bacterium]|nr:hypothetical protein [Hyphomicrobiaceae bacterium]